MPDRHRDTGSLSMYSACGDEEAAFNQLFRENFRALSFFAHSIIGQELYAKDIVQECFIKIWNRRAKLIGLNELRSYLYTAVKNDCINYLRSQAVQDKKWAIYLEHITEDTMPSMDQEIIHAETMRELHSCIEQLPEKMREVVKLYYIEGKSSGRISCLLQKNRDTIHHQRKAALRLLRNLKSG
jgi:RNA polymerase sigma-70 factor (family 1)